MAFGIARPLHASKSIQGLEELVVCMATENRFWGYDCTVGVLAYLTS